MAQLNVFRWNGEDVPMLSENQQIPLGIPVGSKTYKKLMRFKKHERRAKSLAKLDSSDDQISWSTLGLRSTEEVKEVEKAARNSSTQLENGWSYPQYTVATRYYKARLAKPTLCSKFQNIEIEAAQFISLWESRGYVSLRGPIGTAKCTFGLCTWVYTGDLPQIRELIDDDVFKATEKSPTYHVRRRILQFLSLSPFVDVAYQFTGYINKPSICVPRGLFVAALAHIEKMTPSFQCGEDELEGYIDECPEFQAKFLDTWKTNILFGVFDDAKKYITEQIGSTFEKYGTTIVMVSVGGLLCIIAFALLAPTLAKLVSKWAMGEEVDEDPEHQLKDDYIPVISDITCALTKYMNGPIGNVNIWASELSKAGAQVRNIEYLFNFVLTKFSTMVDFVSMKIYKTPFFEASKHVMWAKDDLDNLTTELKSLSSTQLTRMSSQRVVDIFDDLAKKARIFAGMGPIGTPAKMAVEHVMRAYKESYESAMQAVHAPTTRVEPVWVHILGPPNMGKSTFSYALAATVHKHFYGRFEESDVYPVNEENEFWDGFYGQKILFIDEHLVKKDVASRSDLATELVHIVNTMPHPIISAALSDKGKHWIDCDLVITTNNDSPYPSELGLKEPNAYFRRRTLVLELIHREGDNYSFRLHPILPPKGSLTRSTEDYPIENGGQITQRVIDAIEGKRSIYSRLKGKTTAPEVYTDVSKNFFSVQTIEKPQLEVRNFPDLTSSTATLLNTVDSQLDDEFYDCVDQHGDSDDDEPMMLEDARETLYNGKPAPHANFMYTNIVDFGKFLDPRRNPKSKTDQAPDFNGFANRGQNAQRLIATTCNFKYRSFRIVDVPPSTQHKAFSYVSGWLYPYKESLEDMTPTEAFELMPLHQVVIDSPYNRQFWTKACKAEGVAPLRLDWMLLVCQHKLTYADLLRMVQGIIAKTEHVFHELPYLARVFMLRWFASTRFVYSLLNVAELEHVAKHYPQLLPTGGTNFSEAFVSMEAIWNAKYGLSRSIVDKLRDPKWVLMGMVATAALSTIALCIYKWLTGSGLNLRTDIELQSDNKHMNNTIKKTLRANKRQRQKKRTVVVESHGDDTNVEFHSLNMGMVDKVANNIEHMVFHYDNGSTASQFGLFLKGNKLVTTRHPFFKTGKKVTDITFSFATSMPYKTSIDSVKVQFDKDRDLAFLVIDGFPVMFSDISGQGYLKSRESRPTAGTMGATRIQFTSDGTLHLIQGGGIADYNEYSGRDEEKIKLTGCHKIIIGGVKGMCGLAYIFDNTKVSFIGGIHCAGTESFSVFSPIYIEDMSFFETSVEQQAFEPTSLADFVLPDIDLLREIKPSAKEFVIREHPEPSPLGVRTIGSTSYNFVGPSETKLRQSIIALDEKCPFKNDVGPAKLKPFVNENGETISPLNNSFKKFEGKMLNELPREFHEFDVCSGVFTPDKPWGRFRELTFEEAINGVPEWGNCHGIDMDTSAGVGYVNHGIKRKDLFTKEFSTRYGQEIYRPKPVLLNQLKVMYNLVKLGCIPRCMALGLLKDEKRPKSRVLAGASRLFYAADIVHLIISRVFLGGLISASETNVSQSDIMVGINPLGPEWGLLFNRLTAGQQFKVTSTDVEGWDINFILTTVLIFGRALKQQFPDRSPDLIRGVICMLWSSVNPFVFIGNKVFWMWIMCSGTLATSWFNSVANSMLHRGLFKIMLNDFINSEKFSLLKKMDQDWYLDLSFDRAVKAGFFGDDNTQGVHPKMEQIYNGKTLAAYRKKYLNWTTTDPFKGLEIKEFDTYDTTVLLKRFFLCDGPYVRGGLDKSALEGIVLWYMKGTNPDATQQAINMHVAIRESYFWGKEYFTTMLTLLQPYLLQLSEVSHQDHSFKATFEDLDKQWVDQFY